MSKTKEEIEQIIKDVIKINSDGTYMGEMDRWDVSVSATKLYDDLCTAIIPKIQSHAEQQSIAFAEWKHNKGWVFDGEWYNQPDKSTPLLEAKTLYQLFLNDQNK
jgi:hypothetical protein